MYRQIFNGFKIIRRISNSSVNVLMSAYRLSSRSDAIIELDLAIERKNHTNSLRSPSVFEL